MRKVRCPYCKKLNVANKKATKKSCDICFYYAKNVTNKKGVLRKIKIDIVNWATSQKKECVNCGSKEDLEIDRVKPGVLGGKYEVGNLQILCHRCNTQVKINYSSFEDAKRSHTSKVCRMCKVEYSLTDNFWHRSQYKAKNRDNSKANWHGTCKKCRMEVENNRYSVKCLFCKKEAFAGNKNAMYCSKRCRFAHKSELGHKVIKCAYCGKEKKVIKSDNGKYCNNVCSAKNMLHGSNGFFKSKLNN